MGQIIVLPIRFSPRSADFIQEEFSVFNWMRRKKPFPDLVFLT